MYVISEIKGKEYKKLIEYAYTKCDAVMFVIRKDLYAKEKDKNIINNFNNMINSTSKLNDYLLKKRNGGNWVYSEVCADDDLFQVHFYKFNLELKQFLLANNSLYDWLHPLYPEDIAFFKNGYCWLYSVAHEGICEIYYETENEYNELCNLGIKFDEYYNLPLEKRYYESYDKTKF